MLRAENAFKCALSNDLRITENQIVDATSRGKTVVIFDPMPRQETIQALKEAGYVVRTEHIYGCDPYCIVSWEQ